MQGWQHFCILEVIQWLKVSFLVVFYILLRCVNIFLWNTSLSFHCCSLVPHSSVIGNSFLNYFSRLLTLLASCDWSNIFFFEFEKK